MAEPIGPEVYLAIATSVQKAVNNYRDKKRVEQNHKLVSISADSSKSSLTLPADELLSCSGLKTGNDGYVQWALDSPAHPRNWSRGRKAYDLALILSLEFVMSAISAGGTPASFYGLGVLGHRREVGLVGFTTMYLLGQALGVLLLSPYSDKFGRRTLYIASAFLYSVFCLPVAATSNIAGVFVGRLITGVISAIPALTTRRSIEDLFGTEARMWAFFSWALLTNLGLVLGPIYASYVSVSLDWRWPFYLATIIVAFTGMLMYFIRESHTSQLLERKVIAIQSHRADLILRTAPTPAPPSIIQPLTLLVTKPTVFLSSLINAFSTALLYLLAVAFPLIYAHYAWSRQKTTLIFLFIALGLLLSPLTQLHSLHTIRKFRLSNRPLTPETHLFNLAIGASALAIALWWFAWTIPSAKIETIPWPASAVSLILLGYGVNAHSTALPHYVLDSHRKSKHDDAAASASFTAMLVTKALLSAVLPLFTQQMFENLGNNVAGSVIAAISTACGFLSFILIRYGEKWRGGSGGGASGGMMDDEEASVKMEERKRSKPRKTVRWGDETDSNSSSTDDGSSEQTRSDSHTSENESVSVSGDSELSTTETSGEDAAAADSEIPALPRTGTQISTRDFANVAGVETQKQDDEKGHENEDENEYDNENERIEKIENEISPPPLSKVSAQKSSSESESRNENKSSSSEIQDPEPNGITPISRTVTKASSSSSAADSKKEKKKKEHETKKRMSVDDMDNGRAGGLWGMDLERLAVLPYF